MNSPEKSNRLNESTVPFASEIREAFLDFRTVGEGLIQDLENVLKQGGFTPSNINLLFSSNLGNITFVADVPKLMQLVLEQSREAVRNEATEPKIRSDALRVIRNVVTHSDHVPLSYRLELLAEVPDKDLAYVANRFFTGESWGHRFPKTWENIDREGNWQADFSDIPQQQFERLCLALEEHVIPKISEASHSYDFIENNSQLSLRSDQLKFLRTLTGNNDFTIASVAGREMSDAYSRIDRLQTGDFAKLAFGQENPTAVFRRDVALLSAKVTLPALKCCALLHSYGESQGPAHAFALWMAMGPQNALDSRVLAVIHSSFSKLLDKDPTNVVGRLANALGMEENELRENLFITASTDSVEKFLRSTHAIRNPIAQQAAYQASSRSFRELEKRLPLEAATAAMSVSDNAPYQAVVTPEIAGQLNKCVSIWSLKNELFDLKSSGKIPEKQLPQVAVESLKNLLLRQYEGVDHLCQLSGENERVKVPQDLEFPESIVLASFIQDFNCRDEMRQSNDLKDAIIGFALLHYENRHHIGLETRLLLQTIQGLDLGPRMQETDMGQDLVGEMASYSLEYGNLIDAQQVLGYRKPAETSAPAGPDIVQARFEKRLPNILFMELLNAGYAREKAWVPFNKANYQDLGLEIPPEAVELAITEGLRKLISKYGISVYDGSGERILSFAERFEALPGAVKSAFDLAFNESEVETPYFEKLFELASALNLLGKPEQRPDSFQEPHSISSVESKVEAALRYSSSTPLDADLPANWASLSLTGKLSAIVDDSLSSMIANVGIDEKKILKLALQAYKSLSERTGYETDSAEVALQRINRLQFLVKHFKIDQVEVARIDYAAKLASLPQISLGNYSYVLFPLIHPFGAEPEDKISQLDLFRSKELTKYSKTVLSDIDLRTREGAPKVSINSAYHTLAAVGNLAVVLSNEILNSQSDISGFTRLEIVPRAIQSLGLSNPMVKQVVEYSIVIAKAAIALDLGEGLEDFDGTIAAYNSRMLELAADFGVALNDLPEIEQLEAEIEQSLE